MSSVVVVGAGVGGLAAAIRLALLGHRVTVFERSPAVGGKLGRRSAGGFTFDTGPSLLTLPHVVADLLPELPLAELETVVRHRFPDGTGLDSCRDPVEFAARIAAALGIAAAADWRRLWRRAGRVWDVSWRHVLTAPLTPAGTLRLAWRLRDLAAVAPGLTLRRLGRSTLADPRLRMLLDRYATYVGADPRRAPAALVAIPYAELRYGGWYVPGGLYRIAEALLARAEAVGVTVWTGARVSRVLVAGGRVSGVVVDGTRVPTDVVVSNVDALHLYRDLVPAPRRLAALHDRSLAGFVLLLGLSGSTAGLAHHNVFFPADYDAEFDAVFGCGRPPRPVADPALFVSVPDDPLVRPPGNEAWSVLVNAPPQSTVDWTVPGRADRYADHVLDVLAARGVDVRERVLVREVLSPADLARSAGAPGGSIHGTAGHGLLRPGNRGPARGLFLVGGSVHPGGGVPMVLLSAALVAGLVGPA